MPRLLPRLLQRLPTAPGLDLDALRALIAATVRAPLGKTDPGVIERVCGAPAGDPGMVAWDSPAFRVHADLPAMLCGGFAALMLQSLHPGAMAGVADHSNYRADPFGRLRRTAQFITVTTYGNRGEAGALLARIRQIHGRVVGQRPDGQPYAAEDPVLLRWVHTTEVWSFLRAAEVWGPTALGPGEADRYFRDLAPVAEALGATEVPRSRAEARAFLDGIRGELTYARQARQAIDFLLHVPDQTPAMTAAVRYVHRCALRLLPTWAREMVGAELLPAPVERAFRAGTRAGFEVLRWALGENPLIAAATRRQRARVGGAVHGG